MIDEKKYHAEKLLYSMGEVAELFDVNQSLIRFWEKQFDILKPQKNKKGNRLFTPKDVENLKIIYHLVKERGMTLAGAKKRIHENREGVGRDVEIIDKLQGIRSLLVEIREELKEENPAQRYLREEDSFSEILPETDVVEVSGNRTGQPLENYANKMPEIPENQLTEKFKNPSPEKPLNFSSKSNLAPLAMDPEPEPLKVPTIPKEQTPPTVSKTSRIYREINLFGEEIVHIIPDSATRILGGTNNTLPSEHEEPIENSPESQPFIMQTLF